MERVTESCCGAGMNESLILENRKGTEDICWLDLTQDSFHFHSIDTDHLHEETFRKIEALKMSKPGITW